MTQDIVSDELKKEAEVEADKVIIGSGMDRASVIHLKHLLTTLYVQGYHAGAEPREEQLTKAKEIIKDFLLVAKVEHLKDRYETVDEAEQFLKEVE